MREVREIVAGLEHGRVHQRRQVRVVARLDGQDGRLDGFGLRSASSASMPQPVASAGTHLAILELEDQLYFVPRNLLLRDLRGDPALGRVWLPCPRADVVDVRHGGWFVAWPLPNGV